MQVAYRSINLLLNRNFYAKTDVKVQDKVGTIFLTSDKDLNALSSEMKIALTNNIKTLSEANDVKVILLLSKVKKAFCAGANIKEFQNKTAKDFINNDIFKDLHDTFYSAKKPIIAGVNGVALGGGFQLALLCDAIYCSQEARFALPELNLGLIPGIGGTQRLAKIAGRVNAMHYILTSEFISATRAHQLGVVSEVFKTEQLHSKVTQIAQKMAKKPLTALIAAKQTIKQAENLSMKEGVALERNLFYPLYDTKGAQEGVNAFIEKRPAKFDDL